MRLFEIGSAVVLGGAILYLASQKKEYRIASQNALSVYKSNSTDVCEGTADEERINYWFRRALEDGYSLKLYPGDFGIHSDIFPLVDTTGAGARIITEQGFNGIAAVNITRVSGPKIMNLYVDGRNAYFAVLLNDESSNIELSGVEVKGALDDGIAVSGARVKHVKILHCRTHDVQSMNEGTRAGLEIDGPEAEDILVQYHESFNNGNGLSIHIHRGQTSPRGIKVLDSIFYSNLFAGTRTGNQLTEVDMYNDNGITPPQDIELARCFMQDGANALRILGCKNVNAHDCSVVNMGGYAVQVISEWLGDGGDIFVKDFDIDNVQNGVIVPAPFESLNKVSFTRMRMKNVRGREYIVQQGVEIT